MESRLENRWIRRVIDHRLERRSVRRVCPYFRLPQLTPGSALHGQGRLPVCGAVEPNRSLGLDRAARLCRSGEFPTCERFQAAYPNWHPPEELHPAAAPASTSQGAAPISRHLLSSAAWVIGIPAGITLLIILAIWFTENVWMPPQHAFVVWFT